MQLVEVVRTLNVQEDVLQTLVHLCKRLDKTPVICDDTPGFIVNRLLIPYMLEAIRMVERGDAVAADIDAAMTLGAGHPIGPIELADYVGLDTMDQILERWRGQSQGSATSLPVALLRESPLLKKMIAEGKLGRKTGEGFFKY